MTRTEKTLSLLAILFIVIAIGMHFIAGNAGDKNWLLLAARLMLLGKKLYVDVMEANPPLIIWIMALPVYVSMHLSFLKDYQWMTLMALATNAVTVAVCLRLIRFHPAFADDACKRLQFGLLLCFVFIFLTIPTYFFDREYILLLLIFPYILRYTPTLAQAPLPLPLRIVTGLMAGIGFCIKPHCALLWAGLQMLRYLNERQWRILISIENLLIYSVAALYLCLVWWLAKDYITTVLPMALATYSSYNSRRGGLVYLIGALLIGAITFADFRLRYTSPYRKDIFYLLGVCVCVLSYVFINNGWGYTYSLLISMLLLVNGWVMWEYQYLQKTHQAAGLPDKQFLFGLRACLFNFIINTVIVLALYATVLTYNCEGNKACQSNDDMAQIIRNHRATSFGALIIAHNILPDIYRQTGVMQSVRFVNLWMLPKFFLSDKAFADRHQWILDWLEKGLTDDLNHNQPSIMIVDNSPILKYTKQHVDLVAFFSRYSDFKEAWAHYRMMRSLDYCTSPTQSQCRYDIYEHIP